MDKEAKWFLIKLLIFIINSAFAVYLSVHFGPNRVLVSIYYIILISAIIFMKFFSDKVSEKIFDIIAPTLTLIIFPYAIYMMIAHLMNVSSR